MNRFPRRGLMVAVLVAIAWAAFAVRFSGQYWLETPAGPTWAVMDDIYVSASFARTLAEGHGLRWYPDAPKVEGFSNPLWMLLIAGLHVLPGFTEDRLGAYVFGLNLVVLVSLAFVIFVGLERSAPPRRHSAARWGVSATLGFAGFSLSMWCAQGFEVVLVAFLSTWAFIEALRPTGSSGATRIGVLVGLALWTRMDGVVACIPAIALAAWRARDRRKIARMVGVPLLMAATLFLARRAYYGEWLPNTYYLKLAGWPIERRVAHGLFQNYHTLATHAFLLLPFLFFGWRRLVPEDRPRLLALLAPILTLLYSTSSGGDFMAPVFGYDRHAAAGVGLLIFGLGAVVQSAHVQGWRLCLASALAVTIVIVPTIVVHRVDPRTEQLTHGLDRAAIQQVLDWREPVVPSDGGAAELVYRGKLLERFTRPKARVAVCSAGTIVYFSHRGGVDVLGKVDPYVARLPATDKPPPESRCWRALFPSGHNKEDVPGLFRLRQPELSEIEPPAAARHRYVPLTYEGRRFYGLRGTRLIDWGKVSVDP